MGVLLLPKVNELAGVSLLPDEGKNILDFIISFFIPLFRYGLKNLPLILCDNLPFNAL